MKPTITDYIGKRVVAITKSVGEDWRWGIKLENGAEFRNKDRRETLPPTDLIGSTLRAGSFSVHDTTIHFVNEIGNPVKVGLNPTQYAIFDPAYGGEAYPQWPELLEEAGIPSHPEESVSDPPSPTWAEEQAKRDIEADERRSRETQEFLQEDE